MFSRILRRKNRIYFMITDGFKTSLKKQKHLKKQKGKNLYTYNLYTVKPCIFVELFVKQKVNI